jgi:hypothetical protein
MLKIYLLLVTAICTINVFAQLIEPLNINLNTDWQQKVERGDITGTTCKVIDGAVKIDYKFNNTALDMDKLNPDVRGGDVVIFESVGEWNLSPYSCLEFDYQGDGSEFHTGLYLTDDKGVTATFVRFGLINPGRVVNVMLNQPGNYTNKNFDMSKVRKIGILSSEGGENRYQVNNGSFTVYGIRFSNKDQEQSIAENIALIKKWYNVVQVPKELLDIEKEFINRTGNLNTIKEKLSKIKYQALFQKNNAIAVLGESTMERLKPALYDFMGDKARELQISAASNEYESAQIALLANPNKKPGLVNVAIQYDLIGSDGAKIKKNDIEIRFLDFVNTTPSTHSYYQYIGELANVFMPNREFELSAERLQPIWITVKTAPRTPAGEYHGNLIIRSKDEKISIPLSVKVYDFTLPPQSVVSRQFVYWLPAVAQWYGYKKADKIESCDYNRDGFNIPLDMIKRHLDLLLRYRVEVMNIGWLFNSDDGTPCWPLITRPDGSYDYSLFDELMEFCRERGMRKFSLGDFGRSTTRIFDPAYCAKVKNIMIPYIAHLKAKGWFKDAYFKVYDEPDTPDGYKAMETECRFLLDIDPDINTTAAIAMPQPGTEKYLHTFLFRPSNWLPERIDKVRAANRTASWYWCVIPFSKPYPNYFINYPASDPRIIEWMHWKYDNHFFLHWAANLWNNNLMPSQGKAWPFVAWNGNTYQKFNGEGLFVTPGNDGNLWSTVTLEMLRDGAEDLEYFNILKEFVESKRDDPKYRDLIKTTNELLQLSHVIDTVYSYRNDKQTIMQIREKAASLIGQFKKMAMSKDNEQ